MELKEVFREGWSNQARVDNWVRRVSGGEFADPECRPAWIDALRSALPAIGDRTGEALDAGTGPGTIAQLWTELGLRTTGVDFSPTMLEAARRSAAARRMTIDFIEADAEQPPFTDERFDVISSRLVLFTMPNPGYAVRRWTQLLRTGGRMALIGEERPADADQQQKHQKQFRSSPWQPDEQYRQALAQLPFMGHTAGTLRVVMQAAGLRDIHMVDMQQVIEARRIRNEGLTDEARTMFRSTPYILVGTR